MLFPSPVPALVAWLAQYLYVAIFLHAKRPVMAMVYVKLSAGPALPTLTACSLNKHAASEIPLVRTQIFWICHFRVRLIAGPGNRERPPFLALLDNSYVGKLAEYRKYVHV
jgi:hypothetical protein